MSQQWYITYGGVQTGPYGTEDIEQRIRLGKVPDSARISDGSITLTPKEFHPSQLAPQADAGGPPASDAAGPDMPTLDATETDVPPVEARAPETTEPHDETADAEPIQLSPVDSPSQDAPPVLTPTDEPAPASAEAPLPLQEQAPDPAPAESPAPVAPAPQAGAADAVTEPGAPPAQGLDTQAGVRAGRRIVVLGRRAAGKTVFLSTLYARLWNSLDGLTMTARSGVAHRNAMRIVDRLSRMEWPPATLESALMNVEVTYKGRRRLMVSMDYSGEVFRRAFVEDGGDNSREVRELFDHLDNAGAIMLLMDPAVVYDFSGDIDAAVDDDFGMVQAVKRIREWPGGERVPVVLVLTKMDQNLPLIEKEGGAANFVRNHWPALTRTLKRLIIFKVSAVQVTRSDAGELVPRQDSDPVNIENPLKYCLKEMEKLEREQEERELVLSREEKRRAEEEMEREQDKQWQLLWISIVAGILLVGAFIVAAIIVYS